MTHPSSDTLAAEERVVEAVADAVYDEMDDRGLFNGVGHDLFDEIKEAIARKAIQAYQKAMREGSDGVAF